LLGGKIGPGEKAGSANAKGSDYSSHNRPQQRNATIGTAPAINMMSNGEQEAQRIITGVTDITNKRSNSKKTKPNSPPGKQANAPLDSFTLTS